ncbi:uncharacterized protein LOC120836788, partial [Ixodes scapularis]|uniref:uncharacterized protein LOC120836788 n=1 Tax=Ixodes scapularis TaxID=6945 RepID=UPI001AA0011E
IAVLTETWLNATIYDSEFVPAGYSALRKDRGSKGGGVCILFKNFLNIVSMPEIPDTECIFCKAYDGKCKYIIGAFYRPPASSTAVLDNLEMYLDTHVKPGDRVILAGDFNLPNVDWSNFSLKHQNDNLGEAMLDMTFKYDLLQVVEDFTRIQGNSASILDLVFVSGTISSESRCEVIPGISDHKAVLLSLEDVSVNRKTKSKCYPNFSRADDVSIIDMLSFNLDDFVNSTGDVNDLWNLFKVIVSECTDRFVPVIVKKQNKKNPWISRNALQLKRQLKRLKKKIKTSADSCELSEKFLDLSLELKPKLQLIKVFEIGGSLTHDEKIISNAFNKHFKSVFTQDDDVLPN